MTTPAKIAQNVERRSMIAGVEVPNIDVAIPKGLDTQQTGSDLDDPIKQHEIVSPAIREVTLECGEKLTLHKFSAKIDRAFTGFLANLFGEVYGTTIPGQSDIGLTVRLNGVLVERHSTQFLYYVTIALNPPKIVDQAQLDKIFKELDEKCTFRDFTELIANMVDLNSTDEKIRAIEKRKNELEPQTQTS